MMLQPGGVSLSVGDVVGKANWRDRHATMMFLHWKGRCGTVRYGTGRDGTGRDGTGRYGAVRDGTGRGGMGRGGTMYIAIGLTLRIREPTELQGLLEFCYLLFANIVKCLRRLEIWQSFRCNDCIRM